MVDVVSGKTGQRVASDSGERETEIHFHAIAGTSYLIENQDEPIVSDRFTTVSGAPASSPKRLGPVQIGLFSGGQ